MNKIFQKEVECSSEYILSDYMGDVKRVLLSRARAIPTSRFVGDGEAEFSGCVEFEIFYSDVEGTLTALKVSSDYDITHPIETGSADAVCNARVSNFSVRLTGPRRFSLKACVEADVYVSTGAIVTPEGAVFEEGRMPEKISKVLSAEQAAYTVSESGEYTDEIMLVEGVEYDGLEILFTSGSVKVIESVASEGAVTVRGEITITSIVRNDTAAPFAVRKVIPFEERINLDGAVDGSIASASAYVNSATASLREGEDRCSIGVSASLVITGVVASNTELEVVTDAYLTDYEVSCSYEDMPYSELVCAECTTECVSVEIPRETDAQSVRDVIVSTAEVKSVEHKLKDNGFEVSGEIVSVCIGTELSDDGSPVYAQIKNTTPFAINVNTPVGVSDYMRLECSASALECESLIDGDKIILKCPLSIGYRIYKDSKIRRLSRSDIVGECSDKGRKSVITVYYPNKDDTLFDVARKYNTTSAQIALDNSLAAECLSSLDTSASLVGVRRLIIKSV